MKINTLKTVLASVILSHLVACSGDEPSEREIIEILQKDLAKNIASSGGALKERDLAINSISKIGCSETEAKAESESIYNCDIKVDIKSPFAESVVTNQRIQLVKNGNGWLLADFQPTRSTQG